MEQDLAKQLRQTASGIKDMSMADVLVRLARTSTGSSFDRKPQLMPCHNGAMLVELGLARADWQRLRRGGVVRAFRPTARGLALARTLA